MSGNDSDVVKVTKDYYDSDDADNFYYTIWGGEDLHLGIYESEDEPIFDASRRTVQRMASKSKIIGEGVRVLDIGAGFGGTARYLAKTFGCHVTCLNLSEKENERNRKMSAEQGVGHLIQVDDGSFDKLHYEDETFDIIWSQDAILHADDREKVLKEAVRVLKKGGEFIFTDPMQADDCPEGVLDPILERIHLSSLGSPGFYKETGKKLGLEFVEFEDQTPNLIRHYSRVLEESEKKHDELKKGTSQEYIDRMKAGLQRWVDGGKNGYLKWGVFTFHKK